MRGVRGVRGLPATLTRVFGVSRPVLDNASLKRVVDGVLNSTGGSFSPAVLSASCECAYGRKGLTCHGMGHLIRLWLFRDRGWRYVSNGTFRPYVTDD